jgi:(p)ppGpp synthase/HD superfamily hydrolase
MEYLSPSMLAVLEFASRAHKSQLRKNPAETPYISHPFAVAFILSKAGFREPVLIAGVLHDVLEDTAVTAEELDQIFGNEVLQLVLGVTENKKLSWAERKRSYGEHLAHQSAEVAAISAADLLANRQSILLELRKGNNPWKNFSQAPQQYVKDLMEFDRERIAVIASLLPDHPLVDALEELENETRELSENLEW